MPGKMDCHGLTDVGKVRGNNEDHFLIADLNKSMQVHRTSLGLDHQTRLFSQSQGQLLLVTDGMGGQAAGERASTLAIDSVINSVLNTMDWFFRLDARDHEDDCVEELKAAVDQSHATVLSEAEKVPRRQGMGTTLTMAYIKWPRAFVVHVGDSRCYLYRQGKLWQITRDHTVAQQLVERGALDPAEVEDSKWSHMLWNVVGGGHDKVYAEAHKATLKIGDALLLCTDGLSKHVPPDEIATVLAHSKSAKEACERLVEAANAAGGTDNTTVVVARFLETETTLEEVAEAEADLEDTITDADAAPAAKTVTAAGTAVSARSV